MHAALRYLIILDLFAPASLAIFDSLIPPSSHSWNARKETLQLIGDLFATFSVFFRASAGTETLRIIFRPDDAKLTYVLSLSVILPLVVDDAVRRQPLWLILVMVSLGTGLGIQVISSSIPRLRTCKSFSMLCEML